MALPTLLTRPEKTISSALSRWNAAALPIQYVLSNTKWPANSESGVLDEFINITGVADDNGYMEIEVEDTHPYSYGDWIQIDGLDDSIDGIYRIISVDGVDTVFTIDRDYVAASPAGQVQHYYQNYTSLVNVYAGGSLIGTIEQKPNTDNNTYVDLRKYVLEALQTKNDINDVGFPNDPYLWTSFYIEFAERYDGVVGGQVVNVTSAYTSDSSDPCYAVHGALQFGNANGGNMAAYAVISPMYHSVSWMTLFDRPKMWTDQYFDISIIDGDGGSVYARTIRVREYDINDQLLNTQTFSLASNGVGLYRVRLDELSYNISTNYILLDWPSPGTGEIRIDIAQECAEQSFHLAWLNTLGGWEYWNFTARKSYGFDIGNVETIKRDILQDWDTEFIAGETEREHIFIEASDKWIVRSQSLTRQQVDAIARIRFSIKVMDFSDPDNPVTVIVDKGSVNYAADQNNMNFIEFTIERPSIVIQQQ